MLQVKRNFVSMNSSEESQIELFEKYRVGQFVAKRNGFFLRCRRSDCRVLFFGRKNRKYCTTICKNRVNNDVQARRSRSKATELKQYEKNMRILEKHYNALYDPTFVARESLVRDGFVFDGLTSEFIRDASSRSWFKYGDFAMQPAEQEQILIIKKPWKK